MSNKTPFRRIGAVIVAYVVALQPLLLPLSVATGGAFDSNLCTSASPENSRLPDNHESGHYPDAALCSAPCCAQGLNSPELVVVSGSMQRHALTIALAIEPAVLLSATGPQLPRAPPV